jgi:hypothetical protein
MLKIYIALGITVVILIIEFIIIFRDLPKDLGLTQKNKKKNFTKG